MPRYLHATTSAVLVGMSYSEFSLISPDELIAKYGIAPLSGEISAGGQIGATVSSGIAFAKDGDHYWSLDSILKSYGTYGWRKKYSREEDVVKDVKLDVENNLTHIRETIIHLMRASHMGERVELRPDVVTDLYKTLDEALLKVKQYYIRNYIVTRYLETGSLTGYAADDVRLYFLDYLVDHIPGDFLSLNETDKTSFINSLETLFKASLQTDIYDGDVSVQFSDYFKITDSTHFPEKKKSFQTYSFDTAMIYPTRRDFFSYLFFCEDEFRANCRVDDERLKQEIEKSCHQVTASVHQLKKALSGEIRKLTEEEKDLCLNKFSIVLLLDAEEDTNLLRKVKYEYRSNRPLQLGSDIKKIATAKENMQTVSQFLTQHGIKNVEVVSIDSLRPQLKAAPQALSMWPKPEERQKLDNAGKSFSYF